MAQEPKNILAKKKFKSNTICSVPGCRNRSTDIISLHSFPKTKSLCKIWKIKLRIGKKITKNFRACSIHFINDDFYDLSANYRGGVRVRQRLKRTAVPSQNLPQSSIPSRKLNVTPRSTRILTATVTQNSQNQNSSIDEDMDAPMDKELPVITNELPKTSDFSVQVNTLLPFKQAVFTEFISSEHELRTSTGIATFTLFETIVELVSDVVQNDFTGQILNVADHVMIVFLKMKQNLSFAFLAILFHVHSKTIARIFTSTLSAMKTALECVIYWPDMDEIRANLPKCFQGEFSSTRTVFDCTEIEIPKLKCLNCKISSYSHYKQKNTCKFLLGVTPAGLISYVSPAFSGKASDKFIFNKERLIDRFESHVDSVMVDKGFLVDNELAEKGIKMFRPPFLKNNSQLSYNDAVLNAKIAAARVHVERCIQRIKSFDILSSKIDKQILPIIDAVMVVACAIVNLSSPILADDKF